MAGVAARARACVLSGLIGDAASIGVHWIYGAGNVRARVGAAPAFVAPDPKNYLTSAYLAHGSRSVGQTTHYGTSMGAQLSLLAKLSEAGKTVADVDALLDIGRDTYWQTFGFGGTYVGYCDTSMGDSLANLAALRWPRANALGVARAAELDAESALAVESAFMTTIKRAQVRTKLEGLQSALVQALPSSTAPMRTYAQELLHVFVARWMEPIGSTSDVQSGALVRMIPFTASTAGTASPLSDADFVRLGSLLVRESQNNDESCAFVLCMHVILRRVIQGETVASAVAAVLDATDPAIALIPGAGRALDVLRRGRDQAAQDGEALALELGQACNLAMVCPLIVHSLITQSAYDEAITRALLAGGDSASRAAFTGAVLGAAGAGQVPADWMQHFVRHAANAAVLRDLESVFGSAS